MSLLDFNNFQKTSYKVNTLLESLVIFLMVIFYVIDAKFLTVFSIFIAVLYIFNYFLIYKMMLRGYIWSTYGMLTIYMVICTIFLGYNYGFSLYSISTISLIYYIKYMATKIGKGDPKPNFWTILIIISCISSSLYSIYHGPIYKIEGLIPAIFLFFNMSCVFFFLGIYSKKMIETIINSEKDLNSSANYDQLTGLANRYKMRSVLLNMINSYEESNPIWLAMIDIDRFKSINDTYSHKSGDDVLKGLSKIMISVCKNATVSRWGGEEFIICGKSNVISPEIIETLRKEVEKTEIISNNAVIRFTITAGVSIYQKEKNMDFWIINADEKLYKGKQNGRNQVVF